jgi:exonuclease SbcC
MRPVRLELDGFTSFRESAVIDFTDSDYFALVGPTGSGKSTIIDAICFALYGSVPRYDRKGLVAPVISQGKLEAKVRLDFSINGTEYTAVRVVRRSGSGASTKEARLQQGEDVLAGNADELSEKVAELIGLSFDHFTRCVVLPQGEFARFLHDKPADRQDLLVKLLNLGVYRRMREDAARRSAVLKTEATVCEERLATDLAFATEEALADATARVERLAELRKAIDDAQPKLDALAKEAAEAETESRLAEDRLTLIEGLEAPKDIDALRAELTAAQKALGDAAAALENSGARVDKTSAALAEAPDKVALNSALKAHTAADALRPKLEESRKKLKAAEKSESAAQKTLDAAETTVAHAKEANEHARTMHAAQDLAQVLAQGEPCPVCLQSVKSLPDHGDAHDLDAARNALAKAEAALGEARTAYTAAVRQLDGALADIASSEERLAELAPELEAHPDKKVIGKALEQVAVVDEALKVARQDEAAARDAHRKAQKAVESIQERSGKARKLFDKTRDQLAPLEPPPAERDDLAADWIALIEWAATKVAGLEEALKGAEARRDKVLAERDGLVSALQDQCRDCEVKTQPGKELTGAIEAHTRATEEVSRIMKGLKDSAELRERLTEVKRQQELAHELDLHLSARPGRFESWIVNEALHRLVEGATRILRQLSNDQYALTIDSSGNFQVTDRHNADEARSARTLSGGETFLASLSLALALADELRDLAAAGAAKLDAIFLDEGFGTLDPETLDTVAATVENLAAEGRMVGIVTHVRDLADRIPLQFRVRKERTSTVERVVA